MRVLAVDFGTSNTVAAIGIDGGAPRLVAIDGSPLMPSSVYRTDDGMLAVGRDADRQARIDPSRYEANPKRRIDDGEVMLGDVVVSLVGIVAAVLGRVGTEVTRQLSGRPDQVRLTHPAHWGQRRRETLIGAARASGLVQADATPQLIPEPVAAATHFATLSGSGLTEGGTLAVYDLGGGTFDVAVVRRRGDGYDVLAEGGLPDLGGVDFDHAIVEHIGRTHVADEQRGEWDALLHPTDAAARRRSRVLMTDVRDAKEALSRYPHTDIALPEPFPDLHLTRGEFEDLIRADVGRSVDLLRNTIAAARCGPRDLAGVYLVGGSSRIPLVAQSIQHGLQLTPTTLDQPETSVATGALYLPMGTASPAAAGPVAFATGMQPAARPVPGGPVVQSVSPRRPAGYGGVPAARPAGGPSPTRGTAPIGLRAQPGGHPAGRPGGPGGLRGGPPTGGQGSTPPPPNRPAPRTGGASAPAAPGRGRRKGPVLIAAAVAVAVAAAIGIIIATQHHGSPQANPPPSGSTSPTQTPPSPNVSTPNYDTFFLNATLRSYVKPVYGQITKCTKGAGGQSSPGLNQANATTCSFEQGYQVIFALAQPPLDLDTFRSSLLTSLAGSFRKQGTATWRKSGQHGNLATFLGTGTNVGALLYWDREPTILGIAVDEGTPSSSGLQKWWTANFER
ncbi:MAG: Hsp70 family protein [Mycobacteriales bacterium]